MCPRSRFIEAIISSLLSSLSSSHSLEYRSMYPIADCSIFSESTSFTYHYTSLSLTLFSCLSVTIIVIFFLQFSVWNPCQYCPSSYICSLLSCQLHVHIYRPTCTEQLSNLKGRSNPCDKFISMKAEI